jgi:biotin synthase
MTDNELLHLIVTDDAAEMRNLFDRARQVRESRYGKSVYFRGLIEFSNYCKNDCFYCGIRCGNSRVERYRLTPDEILACCRKGDALGFRTFVLQSGEDPWWTDNRVVELITRIRAEFPDHAITLSIGEKSRDTYERFFRAGANRYLLRHESANDAHYASMHPAEMHLAHRKQCLRDLKAIGYQTGAGFMVGSPGQTNECLVEDLRFLEDLQPEMVGIGPFIPAANTPFAAEPAGTADLTLRMVALTRLLLPDALIPATTALGTLDVQGREKALRAGANVVMPNLSPVSIRGKYQLYDNKICTGEEAAECIGCLKARVIGAGCLPDMGRGDWKRKAACNVAASIWSPLKQSS